MSRSMMFPVRHKQCGRIHDSAGVEVIARYTDCTIWKCPHCGGQCDDRPIGWGGNVEKVEQYRDGFEAYLFDEYGVYVKERR